MTKQYFNLKDDFEAIIRARLKGVAEICKIPTGWTNYVYKATVQSGAAYIFRFPRHDFWVESLKKEVWFNKFIRDKISVKTANIKYKEFEGRKFSMHRFIKGLTLTEAYPQMTEKQKKILARDIADYILSLRAVNVRGLGLPTFSEFLIGLSHVNNDKNYDYMNLFKPLLGKEKSNIVLVHGDFNPGNIVVNKKFKMIAVLDYAFASLSAGPADLSVLLARTPKDFRGLVLCEYEKKTGKKINSNVLDSFINVRIEVEKDYIKYMARCHLDVILPNL